jgi:hypothetical protein
MNKVICIKVDNVHFSYGFKINKVYDYYKNYGTYFVIRDGFRCGYDKFSFYEQFIDERKFKLLKIYNQSNLK